MISRRCPANDPRYLRVFDHATTQQAGAGINDLSGYGIATSNINRSALHISPVGPDNGVHFSVNGHAELVALSGRDIKLLPLTGPFIAAIYLSYGSATVSCRHDGVVLDYDSTVLAAQTGCPVRHRKGDIKVIAIPVRS